jgi:hypothetical protein
MWRILHCKISRSVLIVSVNIAGEAKNSSLVFYLRSYGAGFAEVPILSQSVPTAMSSNSRWNVQTPTNSYANV